MFDFPKSKANVVASIFGFAMVALGSTAQATETKAAAKESAHETPQSYEPNASARKAPTKKKVASSTQKDKDFEHELVQSDGVNHPREIVSGPGATKKSPVKKAAAATQKDKDFEHALVQSDGVNHPRETVSGNGSAKKSAAKTKAPATQKDKDFEHELVQSDGVNHPREVLKK